MSRMYSSHLRAIGLHHALLSQLASACALSVLLLSFCRGCNAALRFLREVRQSSFGQLLCNVKGSGTSALCAFYSVSCYRLFTVSETGSLPPVSLTTISVSVEKGLPVQTTTLPCSHRFVGILHSQLRL